MNWKEKKISIGFAVLIALNVAGGYIIYDDYNDFKERMTSGIARLDNKLDIQEYRNDKEKNELQLENWLLKKGIINSANTTNQGGGVK